MIETGAPQAQVGAKLVSYDCGAAGDIALDDRLQRLLTDVRHHLGHHVAAALSHAEYDRLVGLIATSLALHAPADIGFICLDDPAQRVLAVNVRHVLANQVSHAQRGRITHAELSLQFLRSHAVTRRAEQVDRKEPLVQRGMGSMHERSRAGVDMVAAMLAGIRQLPAQAVVFAVSLTLRALQLRAAVANHHHCARHASLSGNCFCGRSFMSASYAGQYRRYDTYILNNRHSFITPSSTRRISG